jgi:hypothetical protein
MAIIELSLLPKGRKRAMEGFSVILNRIAGTAPQALWRRAWTSSGS